MSGAKGIFTPLLLIYLQTQDLKCCTGYFPACKEGQLKQACESQTVRYATVTAVAGWACSEFRHEVLFLDQADSMDTEH